MIERGKERYVFSLSLGFFLRKNRYVDIASIYSRRSRVMQDLRVCFIRMFRTYLCEFYG